jgi:hypothetical protein
MFCNCFDEGLLQKKLCVLSSRNGEGHWKLKMMIQLSKLTNIEMRVVVAPYIIQKAKEMVAAG